MVKAKLLVIDDDASVRESLAGYLEDSGYEVEQAADGEEGLQIFDAHHPDLILCDLKMPKKDGLSLLQDILAGDSSVPFIVISGAGVMSDVVSALRLGASDYIVKPVTDLAVVEHAIDKAMERVRLLAENEAYSERLEEANEQLQTTVETLEADLRAGRHVQQAMLPARPFLSRGVGVDYALRASLYLSGDFVDYFELKPGVLLHYIVDVSGHGVSSAMVTILIRNVVTRLRTEWRYGISDHIEHPASILHQLNQELLRSQIGKHATLFIGILDTRQKYYVYANAAHFPYPVLEMDGHVQSLEEPSSPLGLFEKATYSEHDVDYTDYAALAFCSDGLLETRDGRNLGEKELHWQQVVTESRFRIPEICAAMGMDDVTEAPDDMTVMAVTHWNNKS
ncbi:MAG: response regulator [Natronospirillum sp.]|uniref:response regulator n=1 Tax=Natronospirillum sp. TaxID=2812955 RepID=UPI0025E1863B|nr:response regulator [Natronospirillum sp.]MCH8551301.1 response regulator [Natronospirillum sp.]